MKWALGVIGILALASIGFACGGDDDDSDTSDSESGSPTAPSGAGGATQAPQGEDESVFDLEVGDCFNDDEDMSDQESEVEVIDCAQPHDNEVYFEYSIADGSFPGEQAILEEADERCTDAFEPFVGLPYDQSELVYFPVYPTEASWEGDDRIVYCVIYEGDFAKVEGTLEGANR